MKLFCLLTLIAAIFAQTNYENLFLKEPSSAYAYEHLAYYTSVPHVAGTSGDLETAEYTHRKFKEFGLQSEIWPTNVLLSWPKSRRLRMIAPYSFEASLKEDFVPVDPTTGDPRRTPTFNGYAPSGNVTAQVVYANYCGYNDFIELKNRKVPLQGNIVLCKYGNLFRGTKVMIAELYGVAGVLIYSDPADDGYVRGKVFPDGPWRPESGVQRGSVQYLSICAGDPSRKICSSNPNYNYTDGIPKIPVQPISWGDAYPILKSLSGSQVPSQWQGGLNFTYHIGPGPAVVNLDLQIDFFRSDIWNVIAKIPGKNDNENVILGNHRDAWVFGAADPNSGTAALLEVARGYGQLLKAGWQPQRTIYLASWDGEEYGLLGSTNWAEANQDWITSQTVAYLNVDVGVTGSNFGASATPSLAKVLIEASSQVTDPNTGKPLSQVWNQQVATLGSGSDYTAFLDHFGVASMDFSFSGDYGVYHSLYDDIYWMTHFGANSPPSPVYSYYATCAQLWGLVGLKLADATTLPFDFAFYTTQLTNYRNIIAEMAQDNQVSVDLTPLDKAISTFDTAVKKGGFSNAQKFLLERNMIAKEGLPGRPYYKSVIQAPGLYAGYAPSVFPGVAQEIIAQNASGAKLQMEILVRQLNQAAGFLSQ